MRTVVIKAKNKYSLVTQYKLQKLNLMMNLIQPDKKTNYDPNKIVLLIMLKTRKLI